MAEGEGQQAPSQSQGSRGGSSRGGRRRGRGGRGRGRGNGSGNAASRGGRNIPAESDASEPSSAATAQMTAQSELSSIPESSGASRGRRNRRGGRAGGTRGPDAQPRGSFHVGPQRRFGGRLTTDSDQVSHTGAETPPSLSADAPEFVPGQPMPVRSSQSQSSSQAQQQLSSRSRNRRKLKKARPEVPKSTASELWQRIQEDINTLNYECRVCTEEVTRECEVWSCNTCWTVVHLHCAQEWYDSSMKIDNNSGDPAWRCPGCNSHLSEGPNSYHCWCGKETSPSQASNFLPPHSCASLWISIAAAVELQAGRSVTKEMSNILCVSKSVRQTGTVDVTDAASVAVLICGRPLKCGSHLCEKLCHRGPCSTCPEAIWNEISCNCGATVLQPPQPCGTRQPDCTSKCRRQPACGHPTVDHQCHADDVECPPCPYLTEKTCACGKKKFANKPCHIQQAHCGEPCGQKLQCGLHACRKLCHRPGECGDAQNGCEQICGKSKLFCNHTCQNICHGQTPCNESNACQLKMFVSCPCGNHKKEFKCLAGSLNPDPVRPEIKCDEECERLDRNRRLAAALNIDPATHTNDHVPFSDSTLKLYKEFTTWGDRQESQFRVFAANPDEVRLRYEPMRTQSRQFLHLLAEDFGLESKSDDYDAQRSVLVWKADRFVSAPSKTLAQCVKIRATQAAQAAAEVAIRPPSPPAMGTEPFNGFVLTAPRFGITVDELMSAIEADLATLPSIQFKAEFITHIEPNDEVFLKTTAQYAAFSSSTSVETSLTSLKSRLEQKLRQEKIAEGILLCHAESNGEITRREVPRRHGAGGWSAVAGRAASWKPTATAEEEATKTPGRRFVGLKKKKPQQPEPGKAWAALGGDVEC
ncbi:hypothetical protein AK830_g4790 [Neonectria ditissima]|uniref:R3H domain-containing protein n=1 Tax=Neonectria ditissima TaxID=78410 RepID=A0A0P7BM76_9HYPO|nr:hypothetical protein AK830_g4790 [Neonectria ditissima]